METLVIDKRKYVYAKMISNGTCWVEDPSYEDLLEAISENIYRTVLKVPVDMFTAGVIRSFKGADTLDEMNERLITLKEVVRDIFEFNSGCELTFTDEDWENLAFVQDKWGIKLNIKSKSYMSQFFEV